MPMPMLGADGRAAVDDASADGGEALDQLAGSLLSEDVQHLDASPCSFDFGTQCSRVERAADVATPKRGSRRCRACKKATRSSEAGEGDEQAE